MRRGILFGFPVIIREDDSCEPANAFAGYCIDFMVTVGGFNGAVMEYWGCSYWRALWRWLTCDFGSNDDG